MPELSVVIPVFNEEKTIRQILEKVLAVPIEKEIIVVDDCSRDNTVKILQDTIKDSRFSGSKVIYHSSNKGKGESVREALAHAVSQYIVIQDADLEYEPNDYTNLLKPLREGQADIVFGARFTQKNNVFMAHRLGNRLLTGLLNSLFGVSLNDYATCYKMASRQTFISLELKSRSFDIEVEITCKAIRRKLRLVEVPVSYYPRSYSGGKKIRWFDGLKAIATILKYRVS